MDGRQQETWRRRRLDLSLGQLLLVMIGVIIAITMVAVAQTAHQNGDRHRRAEVQIETIRAEGQQLNALRAQGLADAAVGRTRRISVSPALVATGLGIWTELSTALNQLDQLEPDSRTATLRVDSDMLFSLGVTTLARVRELSSRSSQAFAEQAQFDVGMNRLNADAESDAMYERGVADRASASGERAFVLSLAIGLIGLLLIGARFHRLRRKIAVEAATAAAESQSERRLRALVDQSTDVVTVVGPDLLVQWQAASIQRVLGHKAEALIGLPLTTIVHPDDAALVTGFLTASLTRPGSHTLSARVSHADGGWRTVETVADNRVEDPAIRGLVLSMRDVTERKALEDQLRHQAFHDALTGLANRSLFENRLAQALAIGHRTGRLFAVLFLDLDDFKTINDSLGHHRGDELLRAVGSRIEAIVRPADTAARLGGDEFAVLIELADGDHEAYVVAGRLLSSLALPFVIDDRELLITASAGLALSAGTSSVDDLLRNADMAMYAAKTDGKAQVRAFEPEMHLRAMERLELTGELRAALERAEFMLEYQPIVELATARMVGAEALVRWDHPNRARIAPDQFIGLAEETGLIVGLGLWILQTACAQCRRWRDAFPEHPLRLSVNVSTRQLREPDFAEMVAEVLASTGMTAGALTLEITEGVLHGERDEVVAQLSAIKALGVRVAVDDFGTGYSSLSHLRNFPIDTLKIDKSFIDGIELDPGKAQLVRGIVNLGTSLELEVIAEGIERAGQAHEFAGLEPPLGQGFLFFPPLPPAEIERLLAAQEAERAVDLSSAG